MLDNRWDPLPYPYMAIATAHAIDPDEWPVVLNRVLEDVTGEAGVLASAVRDPEVDAGDVAYAVRALAEHLHAMLALWRQRPSGWCAGTERSAPRG